MKNLGRKIVLYFLSRQVRRAIAVWQPKVVAVVGSYGKTSTKFAIAKVLGEQFRVRFQEGNYNDIVSVPLVFFDEPLRALFNPFAWLGIFLRNNRQLEGPAPYDVIVLELGTDTPGDIAEFGRYLHVDIAVVTAIAYEHMEFFAGLDDIAAEELAVATYSDRVLSNADLCSPEYLAGISKPHDSFALNTKALYKASGVVFNGEQFDFVFQKAEQEQFRAMFYGVARPQLYSVLVAGAIGIELGQAPKAIVKGIAAVQPVAGRMQRLKGIRGSTILDETYNASPEAVKAALDTLYAMQAPQKIALLGNMNELGKYADEAHQSVGEYCEPTQLELVLTLGSHANLVLAEAARERGCNVIACQSPVDAGEHLREHIKDGAVVLVKGSQNGVFAEEAVKFILQDPADAQLLVRQSEAWMAKKRKQFPTIT